MTASELKRLLKLLSDAGCMIIPPPKGPNCKTKIVAPDRTTITVTTGRKDYRTAAEYIKWARKHGARDA